MTRLPKYLDAGARGFWTQTHEETRVLDELRELGKANKIQIYTWSSVSGLWSETHGKYVIGNDASLVQIESFLEEPGALDGGPAETGQAWLVVLLGAHDYLKSGTLRMLQELIQEKPVKQGRTLRHQGVYLCLSPNDQPPLEIERLVHVIPFSLPDASVLYLASRGLDLERGIRQDLADAAVGLTLMEATTAIRVVSSESKKPSDMLQRVWDIKAEIFERKGLARVCLPTETLDDVGGFYHFKTWFNQRKPIILAKARDKNRIIPKPKGLLFVGPFGDGKSLLCRAIAGELGWHYIEWDLGRLMNMYVGNTERYTRELLELTELHKPCLVRMDEAAHQLSGHESSGVTDSGVVSRMVQQILTYQEERSDGVFFTLTTNEPWRLPPALIRSRRLDGIWNLGFPEEDALQDIMTIKIRKFLPDLAHDDFTNVIRVMKDQRFTGAEVEQTIVDALQSTYPKDPTIDALLHAALRLVPISRSQVEQIKRLTDWCQNRALPA